MNKQKSFFFVFPLLLFPYLLKLESGISPIFLAIRFYANLCPFGEVVSMLFDKNRIFLLSLLDCLSGVSIPANHSIFVCHLSYQHAFSVVAQMEFLSIIFLEGAMTDRPTIRKNKEKPILS